MIFAQGLWSFALWPYQYSLTASLDTDCFLQTLPREGNINQQSDFGKNQCFIVYSCSPWIHVLMTGKQKLYLSNDLCNKSEAKNSIWPPVHNSYWKLSWNGIDKDGKSIRQWSRREASVLFILWAAADIKKRKMEISEDN